MDFLVNYPPLNAHGTLVENCQFKEEHTTLVFPPKMAWCPFNTLVNTDLGTCICRAVTHPCTQTDVEFLRILLIAFIVSAHYLIQHLYTVIPTHALAIKIHRAKNQIEPELKQPQRGLAN